MNRCKLDTAADNVRVLSLDAIESAETGHPGLPLGCAELAVYLYTHVLKVSPADPAWIDRDRFVLSAGHGSILLYTTLHLLGYGIEVEDLRRFRRVGSRAAGHPEYGLAPGVDTTTGPLGQGISAAVGMALAERMLAERLNSPEHRIIDHYTYVLAGDGDLMEGVTYESCSLAGHLGLGRLIVFFDSNRVTIDGPTSISFSEDVELRFRSTGWQVLHADAYDYDSLETAVAAAKRDPDRPTLVVTESVIGRKSVHAGTSRAHGGAFGSDEVARVKQSLGYSPEERFVTRDETAALFAEARKNHDRVYRQWLADRDALFASSPDRKEAFRLLVDRKTIDVPALRPKPPGSQIATRITSGVVVDRLLSAEPGFVTGSADLTVPCFGALEHASPVSRGHLAGNFINFGVREHAMAAITNGIALHGGFRASCATFLAFSDYLRPALRLAAMMKLPCVFVFTHDSILIGQDGPTHQPVEHLSSVRLIPGLRVVRPADHEETEHAWRLALGQSAAPYALMLTRQDVEVFEKPDGWQDDMAACGAYVVRSGGSEPALTVVATGSEVDTALGAVDRSGRDDVRVVSMPDRELYASCAVSVRDRIVPRSSPRLVVEAGRTAGWEFLFADDVSGVTLEEFGLSGPGDDVARELGLDIGAVERRIEAMLRTRAPVGAVARR